MGKINTAVIMAAGMGTRFGKYTESIPKGFVPYKGRAMVLRSIETLIDCGIERIIIGTGYKHEQYELLESEYPQVQCCFSHRYQETNCLYTLWNCRSMVGQEGLLMLDSDLVYEPLAITSLIQSPYPSAILATETVKFQDSYFIEKDDTDRFVKWSKNRSELNACGELVGIHKLSSSFYSKLCDTFEKELPNSEKSSYEPYFQRLSNSGYPIYVHMVKGLKWYEIDDEKDLISAERDVAL